MLSEIPSDQLPSLVWAAVILFIGIYVIIKITKALFKLLVAIGIFAVLTVLLHDKVPL